MSMTRTKPPAELDLTSIVSALAVAPVVTDETEVEK